MYVLCDRWAVADLKISQNQLKLDVSELKRHQAEQNVSLLVAEDHMAGNDQLTMHTQVR